MAVVTRDCPTLCLLTYLGSRANTLLVVSTQSVEFTWSLELYPKVSFGTNLVSEILAVILALQSRQIYV